ncbi:surface antigen-like protein [Angomonas deanei]|uniref:Uncharacterized protein n=1 Tax=Angomonas deanei TaxID=59799 RepID=A0A7G2CMC6_9TRYP|nr:surface antigen-like protein [Angomonas deanei]CAD2219703.1 hypothetical protein, conserved [Angomonas deanei]|eukprot:EPY31683.1 surface antigen-like protein [Angomonas deanei]
MHLKVGSIISSSTNLPVNFNQQNFYYGNVTVGGRKIQNDNWEDIRSVKLWANIAVDDYGLLLNHWNVKEYSPPYPPSNAFCQQVNTASTSYEVGFENRAQCDCKAGTYKPYCTFVPDPLLYYAGYTKNPPKCAVANCLSCSWGLTDVCTSCSTNYKVTSAGKCIPMTCTVTNCNKCVDNTEDQCQTCKPTFKVNSLAQCVPKVCGVSNCATCVYDSETQCSTCKPTYKPDASKKCVPKVCGVSDCTTCVYDSETQCSTCKPTYKLDSSKLCTPKVCGVTNCTECVYDSETECKTCAPTYKLDSNKKCVPKCAGLTTVPNACMTARPNVRPAH